MNQINKTKLPPQSLMQNAKTATTVLQHQVETEHTAPQFNKQIYGADDVKLQLIKDQNGKCAYCEQSLNGDFGAVEHFRPKGGYKNSANDCLHKPGYYWLAYDWHNLLLSCSECNTKYKRNLFPLSDESQRDILHKDISRENPLLINPSCDNPGDFIMFNRYIIVPRPNSQNAQKAKETINVLQLNDRSALLHRRQSAWSKHSNLCILKQLAQNDNNKQIVELAEKMLADMESEDAEFTGMFKYQSQKNAI